MSNEIIVIMLCVSLLLGGAGLAGLLWGLKKGQFDDYRKFLDGALFDDEDALNDAYELEKRKNNALKK